MQLTCPGELTLNPYSEYVVSTTAPGDYPKLSGEGAHTRPYARIIQHRSEGTATHLPKQPLLCYPKRPYEWSLTNNLSEPTDWAMQYPYTADLMSLDFCRSAADTILPELNVLFTTFLCLPAWEAAMLSHPVRFFAEYVAWGIRDGFCIGFVQ